MLAKNMVQNKRGFHNHRSDHTIIYFTSGPPVQTAKGSACMPVACRCHSGAGKVVAGHKQVEVIMTKSRAGRAWEGLINIKAYLDPIPLMWPGYRPSPITHELA